jgi:hypothetical protein
VWGRRKRRWRRQRERPKASADLARIEPLRFRMWSPAAARRRARRGNDRAGAIARPRPCLRCARRGSRAARDQAALLLYPRHRTHRRRVQVRRARAARAAGAAS